MKKRIEYEDNPFGKVKLGKKITLPGLPEPEEIASSIETSKITLSLSKRSLSFIKSQAKHYKLPYQVFIRRLLDEYAARETLK